MKTLIIKTNDLGYEESTWIVTTNCPLYLFEELDIKYGMKYRHQSTTINQLQHGARLDGYEFSYVKGNNSSKEDYYARYGNY